MVGLGLGERQLDGWDARQDLGLGVVWSRLFTLNWKLPLDMLVVLGALEYNDWGLNKLRFRGLFGLGRAPD